MPKELEISLLLDFYGKLLTEKQRAWLEQYYNLDYSLAEIAQEAEVSRQAVLDGIHRGVARLKKLEQELGMYEIYRVTMKAVSRLEEEKTPVSQEAAAAIREIWEER